MTLVRGASEIVPGVRMLPAPGHNRDMCIVMAESAGRTFSLCAGAESERASG